MAVGGEAALTGSGSVGNVTVNTDGILAPGFGSGNTLTATSVVLTASSDLKFTLGSGTATDSLLRMSAT